MKNKIFKPLIFLILFSNNLFGQWENVYDQPDVKLPWLNALEFRDFNNGFAVGFIGTTSNGCILRTTDNGTVWDTVFTAANNVEFRDVTFADSLTVFAVAGSLIARSDDLGNTWTTSNLNTGLFSVNFSSRDIGYVCGDSGIVYKTINSGVTWNRLNTGTSKTLWSIYFINDSLGFACGYNKIVKTIDGGSNWSIQNLDSNILHSIFFPSDSIGYCKTIGCHPHNQTLYKTFDQGVTWNMIWSSPSLCFSGMSFPSNDSGYIAGQFGISKTTDGGSTWLPQHSTGLAWDFYDDLIDVFFLNNDTGFAVGAGQFYRTSRGGILTSTNNFIQSNEYDNILNAFPNPASQELKLTFNFRNNYPLELSIFNQLGKKVYAEMIYNTSTLTPLNVSQFPEGIYFIRATTVDQITYNKKFVVQR